MDKTDFFLQSKSRYHQGIFRPQNPQKYKGDPTRIIYRSSWELKLMRMLDSHPGVSAWKSEEFFIPYRSPKDGKLHRYFVDFWARMKTKDGIIDYVIEVKPLAQTRPPVKKKRVTKSYLNEIATWEVNQAKWQYAQEYCDKRNMKFQIMTEKELGV